MSKLKEGNVIQGYKIIKPIGIRGLSKVYLAADKKKTLYVIKEEGDFSNVPEKVTTASNFMKEIDILKSIDHPGLPKFFGSFNYKDRVYMIMEYIEGQTLKEKLSSSEENLNKRDILIWGIQLCEILFYLHTLKPELIIYRDIKPSNVIITKNNTACLIDFGMAGIYDPSKNSDTFRFGTLGYMAPEQFKEKINSNPQTDIYALGVLLYQLLSRYDPTTTPFNLPSIRSLRTYISQTLEEIIERAIHLSREKRYEGISSFREKLMSYYKEKFGDFKYSYSDEDFQLLAKIDHTKDSKTLIPPPRKMTPLMYLQVILGFPVGMILTFMGFFWFIGFLCTYNNLIEKDYGFAIFITSGILFMFAILANIPGINNKIYLIKYGKSGTGIFKEIIEGNPTRLSFTLVSQDGKVYKNVLMEEKPFSPPDYKIADKIPLLYDHFNMNRIEILTKIPLKLDESDNFCTDDTFSGNVPLLSPLFPLIILFLYIYYSYF